MISSLLLMVEVQPRWWKLKPMALGWQSEFFCKLSERLLKTLLTSSLRLRPPVGVWNLVGALGFLLCGALGFSSSSKAIWQSDLSTFWGGWAFLIGRSVLIQFASSARMLGSHKKDDRET